MNTKFNVLLILVASLVITSCTTHSKKITNAKDYNGYLEITENKWLQNSHEELNFWTQKIDKNPSQFPYLSKIAGAESQLFKVSGDITYLAAAEKNLVQVNKKTNYDNAGNLRALAKNYISQHKFKAALALLKKAEKNGAKLSNTQRMLFDVHLELGNYEQAFQYLSKIKDFNDFDYLTRLGKWSDHKGDLTTAIKYFEKAMAMAESSNNKRAKRWIYSNIADFYGHANRIEESYTYYLKALELNPNDAYSKKGIAWIVYSYERNPTEALRIINTIKKQHASPSYYLLKAHIADYMNNEKEKNKNIQQYLAEVSNKKYGDMYNKYNALLFADENKVERSMKIAQIEIENRATPQSYDLLAWSYYKKGNAKKALQLVEKHIADKTFEPIAKYHMAEIYKANKKEEIALKLKKELLKSTYELGPVVERQLLKI